MEESLVALLSYVGPVLGAAITKFIMKWLKILAWRIDTAPAIVQRGIVVLLAYALTRAGVELPGELFTGNELEGLVTGGLAMVFHEGDKDKN